MNARDLIKHFKLTEFIDSKKAEELGIDNNIKTFKLLENILYLAKGMELIRITLKCPVYINSGFRCKSLNKAVKGRVDSQHLEALACDFWVKKYTPREIIEKLKDRIPFDQMILHKKFVHVSFKKDGKERKEILEYVKRDVYINYKPLDK